MRKCLRCEIEMIEDLTVMVTNGGYGIDVRQKGMFKGSLGKIKCAVCPECGYTETYIDNTDNIKKLIEKK
ncbi:MAG: nucleic acid-binding protein [Clostridia bacterium]|nr:nucleic acid-binding protein [Clostridia bacterium]